MNIKSNRVYNLLPSRKPREFLLLHTIKEDEWQMYSPFEVQFAFLKEGSLPDYIDIMAVHNEEKRIIKLQKHAKHFYCADVTDVGKFYFCVERNSVFTMIEGNKFKFSMLQPINTAFFEEACKRYNFFFVGDVEGN